MGNIRDEGSVSVSLEEQNRGLEAARVQCQLSIHRQPSSPPNGSYCNATFDGLLCWPWTPAGTTVFQACPAFVHRFRHHGTASRQCMPDGEWYFSPDVNRTWSNYSDCVGGEPTPFVHPVQRHLERIKVMYNVGYGVSLITLTTAIFILVYFRRLHCPRNTVHLNLFLAFVFRATLSFLRDNLLVNHLGLPADVIQTSAGVIFNEEGGTHWQCKLLFSMFNYVLLASNMWIFVEGLYLHTLIIVAVFSERNHIRYYILLGWGGPMVFLVPWIIVRATVENTYCWNTHATVAIFWVLKGPMLVTVAVNFVFFVNIVRVLFTKLVRTAPPRARKCRYRRMAKSTLVLIPLFGVHYVLFLGLPDMVIPEAEVIKLYYEMFFNSFQGFFVACLFCFMNGEVKAEIRKKWIRYKLRSNSRRFQKIYWQTSSSHLTRKHTGEGCRGVPLGGCVGGGAAAGAGGGGKGGGNGGGGGGSCVGGGGSGGDNSSSQEQRDSREHYSGSGDSSNSPLDRRHFRHLHLQQVRYCCPRGHGLENGHVVRREEVRPIIFVCRKNSYV